MPKKQNLDLFADEGQSHLDLFAGREEELDLFAGEGKYSLGKDLSKFVPETGKAVVQTYENFAKAMGGVVNWVGENIANDEPINYTDPLGKQQTIELKKSEFHKKFGQLIAADGQRIYDFWDNRMKKGWEAPDKDLFEGDYFQNPSITRTSAMLVNGLGSLATVLVVAKATNNPALGARVFGLVEGQESYQESRRAGKSVRHSNVVGGISAVGNKILATLPIYAFMKGPEKTIKKGLMATGIAGLKRIAGKLGVKQAPTIGREMVAGMVIEGGEEGAQQFWMNLVAKLGYEDTRDLGKGVLDSIFGGALAGGAGIPAIGAARGLDSRIQGLKKKGLTDSEVGTMATMLSKQMLANAPAVDDALKKEVGLFEQRIEGPSESNDEVNQQFAKFASEGVAIESDRKIHDVDVSSLQEKHQVSFREIDKNLVEGIKGTIKAGGYVAPIIVNQEADGSHSIIAGHHRSQAYKELGIKTIPATVVQVSDAVAKKMAALDNEGNKDTPSIYGRRYRKLIEQGSSLAEALQETRGYVNDKLVAEAPLLINVSYLPDPIRRAVDLGDIPLEVGSEIGARMKVHGIDLTPDVINNLVTKFHTDQGLSGKALGRVLDIVLSVAQSRTGTKEKQLDLFGEMIKDSGVLNAVAELEKSLKQSGTLKKQMQDFMKKSQKFNVELKEEDRERLTKESEALELKIADLRKKLYKFKVDDFVGAVKQVVVPVPTPFDEPVSEKEGKTETIETTVESGSDKTFFIPEFKDTQEAIAFGKLNRLNLDGVEAIRAMLKNIQQPIMDSLKTGDLQRSTASAEKAVLLTAALAAAEGKYDNVQKPISVVNKIATQRQQQDLFQSEKPDEEKNLREDAEKAGVSDKVDVVLSSEEAPEQTEGLQGPLKRAVELREKREAEKLKIADEGREVMIANFEAALTQYGIDKKLFFQKLKKWVGLFRMPGVDPRELISYAWEGAIIRMGAKVESNLFETNALKTNFDPDFDTKKKYTNNTDKFFDFAKAEMQKQITRFGLPLEKRTISLPSYNITENLHNFSNMMQDIDSIDDITEEMGEGNQKMTRWEFYMGKMKYSKALVERFLEAYNTRAISIETPIGSEGETTLEGVLANDPSQVESFGGSEDPMLTQEERDEQFELEEAKNIERQVKREGAMKAFETALKVLSPVERDIVKLSFGLLESQYGVQMSPEEVAEVLNGGMSADHDNSLAYREITGKLADETRNTAQQGWTAKRVQNQLQNALKKLGNVPSLISFYEQIGGKPQIGKDFDSAEDMEKDIFDILGKDGGIYLGSGLGGAQALYDKFAAEYGPKAKDLLKRKAERLNGSARRTKYSVMMPFWLAQKFESFKRVFDPVLKGERKYSRDTYYFKKVMNNFSDLLALGKKRADKVAEVFYQNDSEEEAKLAENKEEELRWYSPEDLRTRFFLDDEQIAVFYQFVKSRDFINALLVRKFKNYNDYYKRRKFTDEDGDTVEESDDEYALRKMRINLAARAKFPRVHVPIYRYGNVWVVAKKFSHVDKKGNPVFDTRMDLVNDNEVYDLRTTYEKDGWKVSVNDKAEFRESSWKTMDLYTLERLLDHAGIHWERAEYRDGQPKNDLAKLQAYVDKLRASRGGLYGHFLKRKRIPGFKTSVEHLKRSMIDFFESSSRTLRTSESRSLATESLEQMPHGPKASKKLNDLYNYAEDWLKEYGHYNSENWARFRTGVYLMALSMKPSWFVQNLTQPFFTTYLRIAVDIEKLKQHHGKTESIFTQAYAQTMDYVASKKFKFWRKVSKGFSGDLSRMLMRAEREGVIKGAFTDALLSLSEVYEKKRKFNAIKSFFTNENYRNTILGMFGSASERLNRLHAFIVGYHVGSLKGISGNLLYEHAANYVGTTQYWYNDFNVPKAIAKLDPEVRGAVQTALLFNSYSFNWMQMTGENISRTLGNIPDGKKEYGKAARMFYRFLMLLMSSYVRRSLFIGAVGHGAKGAFGYWLADLISKKASGKHFHQHIRNFVYMAMPEASKEAKNTLVRILTNGLASHVSNIDFSRLIGYGDVLNMNVSEDYRDVSDILLGAGWSLGKNMYRTPGLIKEGIEAKRPGHFFRGVEASAPGGSRGVFKAIRAKAESGFYTEGGKKIKDLEKGDLPRVALGFTPLSLSEEYDRIKSEMDIKGSKEEVQKKFNERFVEARRNKDKEAISLYKQLYKKWNEEHPDKKYAPDWQYINDEARKKKTSTKGFAKGSRKQIKQVRSTYA